MSAETPTQGRVTTEGPEGPHGAPGAVSGAVASDGGIAAGATVYVVVISDRHGDTDVEIFTAADTAIAYAKAAATEYCRHPQDFAEEQIDGWLYYARYSCEGDNVRVVEKTLRTNGDDE